MAWLVIIVPGLMQDTFEDWVGNQLLGLIYITLLDKIFLGVYNNTQSVSRVRIICSGADTQ
jgi:hypothetical protein